MRLLKRAHEVVETSREMLNQMKRHANSGGDAERETVVMATTEANQAGTRRSLARSRSLVRSIRKSARVVLLKWKLYSKKHTGPTSARPLRPTATPSVATTTAVSFHEGDKGYKKYKNAIKRYTGELKEEPKKKKKSTRKRVASATATRSATLLLATTATQNPNWMIDRAVLA